MKVRCIELIDTGGNLQEHSSWLTVGKVYPVLEVVQDIHRRWLLRLVGDTDPGVGLFPLQQFEVVSARISPTWVASWGANSVFQLAPEPWTKSGFWENYYDRKTEAVRIFEEERKKIIEADP